MSDDFSLLSAKLARLSRASDTTIINSHQLLVVSSAAVILVACFIAAMTILEAAQPRVLPPTAGAKRTIAPPVPSSLISPVPVVRNPALR